MIDCCTDIRPSQDRLKKTSDHYYISSPSSPLRGYEVVLDSYQIQFSGCEAIVFHPWHWPTYFGNLDARHRLLSTRYGKSPMIFPVVLLPLREGKGRLTSDYSSSETKIFEIISFQKGANSRALFHNQVLWRV